MKAKIMAGGSAVFIYLALLIAGVAGYVMNIIAIFSAVGSEPATTMFIARCVGVLAFPLGAVLGWF